MMDKKICPEQNRRQFMAIVRAFGQEGYGLRVLEAIDKDMSSEEAYDFCHQGQPSLGDMVRKKCKAK